jgi:hypothetical protein
MENTLEGLTHYLSSLFFELSGLLILLYFLIRLLRNKGFGKIFRTGRLDEGNIR